MCAQEQKTTLRQRLFARLMKGEEDISHEIYREKKESLFSGLSGKVLEIGPGTGVNLCYYPKSIEWTGIEPNPAMHPLLEEKARALGFPVTLKTGLAEASGVENGSMDYVISTTVLCSVKDMAHTLTEIRRALRPGGTFLFLEHVVDPHNRFRRLVQKLMPYTPWRYFSDGCDPGRDIGTAIKRAGFAQVECHHYHQTGAGLILSVNRPHIYGRAVK